MNAFLEAHQLHPVVDHAYAFNDAPHAFAHLRQGAFGKVVVQLSAA